MIMSLGRYLKKLYKLKTQKSVSAQSRKYDNLGNNII